MARPRPLNVLVVDDYPDSAEALAQLLNLMGYDARAARSCAEARAAVTGSAAFVPDAVVLDVRLSDGDGFALAAELCGLLPARPVFVALTGLPNQEANCRAAGIDYYMLKPADPAALTATLAQCGPKP